MTWTYGNDPSNSDRDAVRLLIQDTDTTDQKMSDESITWANAQEPNVYLAAALLARALIAKFASKVDKSVGDLKLSYRNSKDTYKALAVSLEERGNINAAFPYAGGISISDKDAVEEETDRVIPSFTKGMHDNPRPQDDIDKDLLSQS